MSTTDATAPTRPARPTTDAWFTTGDHKRLGRLYLIVSFLYLLLGGITGGLLGLERTSSGLDVLDSSSFGQIFSLHGVSATWLFLIPAFIGLATYLVPIQVGARNIGLPRVAATGFWLYVVGAGLVEAAYLGGGGPGTTDADANALWVLGLGITFVGLVAGSIAVVTTVAAGRLPGVAIADLPPLSIASFAGGILQILSLPVLVATLILSWVDLHHGGQIFGGDFFGPVTFAFTVPTIYLVAVPAAGVITEIIARATSTVPNARVVRLGIYGLAIAGFGGYASPLAETSLSDDFLFQAQGLVVLAPALMLLAAWADMARRADKTKMSASLGFAVAAAIGLISGVATGALASIDRLDLIGTTWVGAQLHFVTIGCATMALFGGLHLWSAKLWGKTLNDAVGLVTFAAAFAGTGAMLIPDLLTGVDGMALADPLFDDSGSWEAAGVIVAIGGGLVIGAALLMALNLLGLMSAKPAPAEPEPGEGLGLEWAVASPPPPGNFDRVPEIAPEVSA